MFPSRGTKDRSFPPGAMPRGAARAPRSTIRAAIAAAIVTCATHGFAQDRADIDRTQIIGNRELPKVLYIVPWKKPLPGDLSGRPMASVLDEVLSPVDRDVFRRQVRYDAMTQTRPSAPTPR
jgi:hypothetical protein